MKTEWNILDEILDMRRKFQNNGYYRPPEVLKMPNEAWKKILACPEEDKIRAITSGKVNGRDVVCIYGTPIYIIEDNERNSGHYVPYWAYLASYQEGIRQ